MNYAWEAALAADRAGLQREAVRYVPARDGSPYTEIVQETINSRDIPSFKSSLHFVRVRTCLIRKSSQNQEIPEKIPPYIHNLSPRELKGILRRLFDIFQQVPRLAVKQGTNGIYGFPGNQFSMPNLLQIGLTN